MQGKSPQRHFFLFLKFCSAKVSCFFYQFWEKLENRLGDVPFIILASRGQQEAVCMKLLMAFSPLFYSIHSGNLGKSMFQPSESHKVQVASLESDIRNPQANKY